MKSLVIILLFLASFLSPALAESSGVINNSGNSVNNTFVVTGLLGYTVQYCDTDADCGGYKCFVDFDGEAVDADTSQPSGWCNATAVTNCYNDGTPTASGSAACTTNTTLRTCTSGAWDNATSCSSGNTCSGGVCSSSSSSSSSSGGGGGSSSSTQAAVLAILNIPSDFSVVQGETGTFSIDIGNNGNLLTQNVTVSVAGTTWATVIPSIHSVLSAGNSKQFNITVTVPAEAEVKSYTFTINAASTNATASNTFTMKVLPGAATAGSINQTYLSHLTRFTDLDAELDVLAAQGAVESEVNSIRKILTDAQTKIKQANTSINTGDYFTATTLLQEADQLLNDASNRIRGVVVGSQPFAGGDGMTVVIIILIVVAAVVGVILFLFWPTKTGPKNYISFRKTK